MQKGWKQATRNILKTYLGQSVGELAQKKNSVRATEINGNISIFMQEKAAARQRRYVMKQPEDMEEVMFQAALRSEKKEMERIRKERGENVNVVDLDAILASLANIGGIDKATSAQLKGMLGKLDKGNNVLTDRAKETLKMLIERNEAEKKK